MIHVLAMITAKPGKRDAILEAFRANLGRIRNDLFYPDSRGSRLPC